MAWDASKTTMTQLTSITNTEQFFTEEVDTNPGEAIHFQFLGDFVGTTDDMIFAVYGTLDASAEQWDTQPICESYQIADTAADEETGSSLGYPVLAIAAKAVGPATEE